MQNRRTFIRGLVGLPLISHISKSSLFAEEPRTTKELLSPYAVTSKNETIVPFFNLNAKKACCGGVKIIPDALDTTERILATAPWDIMPYFDNYSGTWRPRVSYYTSTIAVLLNSGRYILDPQPSSRSRAIELMEYLQRQFPFFAEPIPQIEKRMDKIKEEFAGKIA